MKKRSKIILVLSFVIVFAFSLSINIFADSAAYGDTELKPVFAPSVIEFYSESESIVYTGLSNIVVDLNPDNIDDTVFSTVLLTDYDANDRASRNYYLSPPSEYSDNLYTFNFGDSYDFYDLWSKFKLKFNDFYYDGSSLNLWGYFPVSLTFSSGYNPYIVSLYALDCDISYLSSSGELVENSPTFSGATYRDVVESLDYYISTNYSNGALVQNVTVYPLESSGNFGHMSIDGDILYTYDHEALGSYAAFLSWYERFGGSVESPTILESVSRGLNAVWDTSLFGLFTIGEVFSACAGVALFTWLLKIFNR